MDESSLNTNLQIWMPSPASVPELVPNFCKWSRLDISECVHHSTLSQKRDAKLIRTNGRRTSWTLRERQGMKSQCFSAPDEGAAKSQRRPWPTACRLWGMGLRPPPGRGVLPVRTEGSLRWKVTHSTVCWRIPNKAMSPNCASRCPTFFLYS